MVGSSLLWYLEALSRCGDIVLAADTGFRDGELEKLKGLCLHAEGCAHGEYDFGAPYQGNLSRVNVDLKFYGITTRYVYPLSEQASLYAGAGYGERKYDVSGDVNDVHASDSAKEKIGQVYAGLSYVF